VISVYFNTDIYECSNRYIKRCNLGHYLTMYQYLECFRYKSYLTLKSLGEIYLYMPDQRAFTT